jgi:flagellar motility protein MotE (MotC chaperone)
VLLLLVVKIALGGWYILANSSAAASAISIPTPLAAPLTTAAPPAQPAARSNGYLEAAVAAVSPASAQAAPAALPLAASPAISPISAGALLVVGQAGARPAAAQPSPPNSIPLPAGSQTEHPAPAAALPAPSLPKLGAGFERAPLPPNVSTTEADTRKLREREQALARKEANLATREEALTSLETELRRQMAAADQSKSDNEALLKRNEAILAEMKALREQQQKEEEALKDARIQHLVIAYGGMKPEQAGNLINSLDDDVAVSILSAMAGRKAGLILAYVNPDKAARLTKAISERRIDPNLLLADAPAEGQ